MEKTYPRVTSPFLPCRSPLIFLSFSSAPPKKRKSCIFLIHRKLWLGCFKSPHLGVLGESLVFPPALPRAPVLGGDFLGAGGGAGAEDAAAAAPGRADSAGEGGAAAAGPKRVARSRPLGRKLLASAGGRRRPLPWPGLAAGAPRMGYSPRPRCGGRRPRCPHAASASETLLVAPGSFLVPRPPSPGARVLRPPPGARRAAL